MENSEGKQASADLMKEFANVVAEAEKVLQTHKNLSIAFLASQVTNLKHTLDERLDAHRRYVNGQCDNIPKLSTRVQVLEGRVEKASKVFEDLKIEVSNLSDRLAAIKDMIDDRAKVPQQRDSVSQ